MSIIDHRDKLYFAMLRTPFEHVRQAFVQRSRVEHDRADDTAMWMADRGYELVDAQAGSLITDDGREIIHVYGKAWALRAEVHAERLTAEFAAASHVDASPESGTKSIVGTESLSSMTCPKCGDSLQHTTVCPSCSAGRLGYRHRYTCVCCNVDIISKEVL